MQSNRSIALSSELLRAVFPFHLALDRDMCVIQMGGVLTRICPRVFPGIELATRFRITRPEIPVDFEAVCAESDSVFLLEDLDGSLRLKGQMVPLPGHATVLFLCTPWITDPADIARLGLSLSDFALHDLGVDFLFTLQAQNSALADAQNLANQLTTQRAQLRATNRQLTTQFRVTRALAESATMDEAAPKVLQAFCDGMGWDWGCLWRPDRNYQVLRCAGIWNRLHDSKDLEEATWDTVVKPGEGLLGRVWEGGEPIWLTRLEAQDTSRWSRDVIGAGFQSAFAFPVRSKDNVVGIIEFLSRPVRESDAELSRMLVVLGTQIGQFIENKLVDEMLRESREKYRLLFDSNPEPMWVYDIEDLSFLAVNDTAINRYGYSRDEFMRMRITDLHLAEDIPSVLEFVNNMGRVASTSGPWRHRAHNGMVRWVEIGSHLIEYNDRLGRIVFANDVTERLQAEAALRESDLRIAGILASITDSFFALDRDWRFTYVNPQIENLLNSSGEALIGRSVWDVFPPGTRHVLDPQFQRALADMTTVSFEIHYPPDEAWYDVRVYPSANGLSVYFQDVTARKQAEEALQQVMSSTRCLLWHAIVEDQGGGKMAWTKSVVNEEAAQRFVPLDVLRGESYADAWDRICAEQTADRIVAVPASVLLSSEPGYRNEFLCMSKGGVLHWLNEEIQIEPIGRGRWRLVGVCTDITERKQAAELLAQAREREISIGSKIQETLLVRQPPTGMPGISVGARSLASQQIDGDYFDFFEYESRRLDVVVGDVMGKGVPAALIAAASKTQFQRAIRRLLLALRPYGRLPEPEEIVMVVHRILTGELVQLDSFLTLCYVGFDIENRLVKIVDCGHPRAVHYQHRTGTCSLVQGDNLPLGFSEQEVYTQLALPLETGDLFFLYSDGVTEAHDASGQFYGEERLVQIVSDYVDMDPAALVDRVCESVSEFSGSSAVADDVTCVAIRIGDLNEGRHQTRAFLELEGDLSELDGLRTFVREFCLEMIVPPLDDESVADLGIAVNEAVVNCIQHGYPGRGKHRIQLEAIAYSDRVTLYVYDWGQPFDPSAAPAPVFDGTKESGFGVYIIKHCMDQVEYSQDELGRNCLKMTKLRSSGEIRTVEIQCETINDVVVAVIPGDKLDASNANELKQAVAALIECNHKVVFDLGKLQFVDSSGLGAILSCLRLLNGAGGDLKLCGMQKSVRSLFELVRMHRVFDIAETSADAVKAFQ